MAAKLTANSFLEVIERSGLIRPDQLDRLLKELEDEGVDLDHPKVIANTLIAKGALTEWQAENLLQGRHRGFVLGPYRFLRLLGRGGMGAVYLAEHQMMRRRCAIKVLPSKHVGDDTSMLERFELEMQAAAHFSHDNIVRAYDANKEIQGKSEIYYLVMEYVEGEDIQNKVADRGEGLDFVEAADFTRQAAKGLAHAHENGLVHRDIKPANLLVDTKGVVKILDLGLARFFDDDEKASLTAQYNETTLGTADYLSPEQALNSHDVDTRTDIYSLGCTLYFMLTGRPTFPEGTVAQRLLAHQVKAPAPIAKFRPDVPSDLVTIVDRMIAKKPEHRFQTAAEVADVLADWLSRHANDEWIQQHPDIKGEGSGAGLTSRREPTNSMHAATYETEIEFGLAPSDDDQPAAARATSDSGTSAIGGDSAIAGDEPKPREAVARVELDPLDELPPSETPLDDLDLGSLEALPEQDALSEPLASSSPSSSQMSFGPPSAASSSSTRQSGVHQLGFQQPSVHQSGVHQSGFHPQVAGATSQSAGETNTKSDPWRILIPVVIGVGILVPVIVIILIILSSPPSETSQLPPDAAGGVSTPDDRPVTPDVTPNANGASSAQENRVETRPQPSGGNTNGGAVDDKPNTQGTGQVRASQGDRISETGGQPKSEPPKTEPPKRLGSGDGTNEVKPPQTDVKPPPKPESEPPKIVASPPRSVTPPTPVAEPMESPEERNQRLFAGISEVGFKLDSVDKNAQSPLNLTIGSLAEKWLLAMGLTPTRRPDAPAILHVSLTAETVMENDADLVVFKLAGDLRCNHEGEAVSVWKHDVEIGRLQSQLLGRGISSSLLRILRENTEKEFYRPLHTAHAAAVAKVKGE